MTNWLTDWVSMFFSQINESVKPFGDNHLILTIEPQEQGIRFFFDFCGIIEKIDSIEKLLTIHHGVKIDQFHITEQEFSLEVFFNNNHRKR